MENNYLRIINDKTGNKIFRYNFPNITSLVSFLKKAEPNRTIFPELNSIKKESSIYGEDSYEETLDKLLRGYSQEYSKYRNISKIDDIKFEQGIASNRIRSERSYVGYRADIPAYIYGSPKNMRRIVRSDAKKYITVYYQLSYGADIRTKQVINRGLITLEIVKALEKKGYAITLIGVEYDYETVQDDKNLKEYFIVNLKLKDPNEILDESKCMGPFMRIEFLRRVLFRLLEVSDVNKRWSVGYGSSVQLNDITDNFLKLGESDIYISGPKELGIKGEDIYEDFESVIKHLNLLDVIELLPKDEEKKEKKLK